MVFGVSRGITTSKTAIDMNAAAAAAEKIGQREEFEEKQFLQIFPLEVSISPKLPYIIALSLHGYYLYYFLLARYGPSLSTLLISRPKETFPMHPLFSETCYLIDAQIFLLRK